MTRINNSWDLTTAISGAASTVRSAISGNIIRPSFSFQPASVSSSLVTVLATNTNYGFGWFTSRAALNALNAVLEQLTSGGGGSECQIHQNIKLELTNGEIKQILI